MLATSPADVVVPPRARRSEMKVLDEIQAAVMLRAAEGTGLSMALLLALGTGMRRGELLAAHWSDVDLEAGTITVNQTLQAAFGELHFREPKTAKSRRRIILPGIVVDRLRAHRAEQAKKTLSRVAGLRARRASQSRLRAEGSVTPRTCRSCSRSRQECRMDLLYTCGSACSLGREFVLTPAPAVRASV